MSEIKRKPKIKKTLRGEEVTFDDQHTHADILRYVVGDIGWVEARMILDSLRPRAQPEGERIEVTLVEIEANCSCEKARTWMVDTRCGHFDPDLPTAVLYPQQGDEG